MRFELPQVAVDHTQGGMSHGKVWVQFDGALQVRNGFLVVQLIVLGLAQGEGLQGLQGRGCGLFQRCSELLHRTNRFAQFLPQTGSSLVKRLQHLLFTVGLYLGASQGISGLRVHRVQINHVVAAKRRNRARQHGFYAIPQADFPRYIAGHPLVGRPPHQAQRSLNSRLRKNVQIRRLLQLHRQGLLQSSIEDARRRWY